ncbi:DUF892 family protein [Rhodoplanes sp. SY1]|uniref:DUF892 family protein n=1 Tax=Rhodoplanes sp. SY1 TaxID=3166646 RepID=UPI0038B56721
MGDPKIAPPTAGRSAGRGAPAIRIFDYGKVARAVDLRQDRRRAESAAARALPGFPVAATRADHEGDRRPGCSELRSKIETHLEQTRSQADRLRSCIERQAGSTSTFKDTTARVSVSVRRSPVC